MIKLSKDIIKSIENSILFLDNINEEITTKHLFLGLAFCKNSNSKEILNRLGINEDITNSFLIREKDAKFANFRFSQESEKAICKAKEIAQENNYIIADSQHLLLAIIEISSKDILQLLLDFQITYAKIKDIVESMSYNGIGKNNEFDIGKNIKINYEIKNKDLERKIQNILSNKNFDYNT